MKSVRLYAFADEAAAAVDDQIAALKRNGLDGIEIRNVDGMNVSDISAEKAKEVKRMLDANGLVTWSVGSPIGKIDIEKDDFRLHIEKFKHTLEIAEILEAGNIRVFSFYMPDGKEISDYKNEVIERLGVLCDISRGFHVSLCHENEKGIYGDRPERCLELFAALPQLGGVFDPANFVQSGVEPMAAWDRLKAHITYLHIKDARADGTIVPAGMGDGHVAPIVRSFISGGGSAFTIEPHLAVFQGFSALEREGEKSAVDASVYPDSGTAFDAACEAFKELLFAQNSHS